MATIDPRRKQILALLEETGTLNVSELADRFGVSVVTIRKDLDDLEAEGFLQRTFGGAVFSHRSRRRHYRRRRPNRSPLIGSSRSGRNRRTRRKRATRT